MPWSSSTRGARLPTDWHKRRARTWRAAKGQCQAINTDGTRCPWRGRLNGDGGQCDHIDRHGGDEQPNLQWLCPDHHRDKTLAEAHGAARQARPDGRHPIERHPGLT